jgi:hypothetical protein
MFFASLTSVDQEFCQLVEELVNESQTLSNYWCAEIDVNTIIFYIFIFLIYLFFRIIFKRLKKIQ